MDIATVRQAIADGLDTITGLQPVAYVTDQVTTMQATIERGEITYDYTFGGAVSMAFSIVIFAGRSTEVAWQQTLDALANPTGAGSVREALEDTDVWTAAGVSSIRIAKVSPIQNRTMNDITYLSEEFTMEVVV